MFLASHGLVFVLYCIVFQRPQPHDTHDWTKGRACITAHCPDSPIASQRVTSFKQSGPRFHTTRSTGSVMSEAGSKPYLLLFLFLPNLYDLHFLACLLNLLLELFPFISLIFPLHIQTVRIIVTTHIHIIYSPPRWITQGG